MRARSLSLLLFLIGGCHAASPTSAPPGQVESNAAGDSATSTPALPHDGPGLAVGQTALPFTLQDQHGQSRSLDQWLGQGPVAVVFFRSADW